MKMASSVERSVAFTGTGEGKNPLRSSRRVRVRGASSPPVFQCIAELSKWDTRCPRRSSSRMIQNELSSSTFTFEVGYNKNAIFIGIRFDLREYYNTMPPKAGDQALGPDKLKQ